MTTTTALPTVEACDEALNALGELFNSLPPSHRPLHAGNREDVRRILERIKRFVIAQQGAEAGAALNAPAPAASLTVVESAGAEENEPRERTKAEMKKAMQALKSIFDAIMALEHDEDRRELFDRLLDACCPRCGAKVSEDEEHDCREGDEDDDDEESDEEEEEPES